MPVDEPLNPEMVIFNAAIELPLAERRAFLEKACVGDSELLRRIESLLDAHEASGGFLLGTVPGKDSPPATGPQGTEIVQARLTEKTGDVIGRYKLLQQIGEGGCGVVYMAEQTDPVKRQVALKVIKLGMDTKSVIARFEAERQALALMDHPNIARVLDAGATETGRPYFVMELVRGIKITEFCDKNNLSMRERLDLFVQICLAIQHAHQKGVIHRDIKPSNILVTLNDGVPMPKVIDFGIAKATQQPLTDKTLFTAFDQFIGTPAYMSPEQAEMNALGVDTRSDIYSLGVLLYELLTGKTPFGQHDLLKAGLDEIRRIIREEEPMRPSTRLGAMAANELTTTANCRRVEPPKLVSAVRGELDWIVMKALEKDRVRRYETATSFAHDIERYLADEPVQACPPSKLYLFRKTIRRHKFAFALVGSVLAALAIGLVVSSYLLLREKQARREAAQAEQKAQLEARRSQETSRFLEEMLQGAGPSVALGRDTTMLQEILSNTAARIDRELTNEPEVAVNLQLTLGNVYMDLGENQKAEEIYRKALVMAKSRWGEENDYVASSLFGIGDALRREYRYFDSESFVRESMALTKKLNGNESKSMAYALNLLGDDLRYETKLDEAESVARQGLAMSRKLFGAESRAVAESLNNLALVLRKEQKMAEAEAMFRESLQVDQKLSANETPDEANTMANLGEVLLTEKKLAEADRVLRDSLKLYQKFYGDNRQTFVVDALFRLEDALALEGKYEECLGLLDEMLKQPNATERQKVRLFHARSTLYARQGRWREAIPDMSAAMKMEPYSYSYYLGLGTLLAASGDMAGYQKHCEDYLARFATNANHEDAYWLARTCVVVPCPGINMEQVSNLSQIALTFAEKTNTPFLPGDRFLMAIVDYRLGHFEKAIEYATKSLDGRTDGADNFMYRGAYYILAMAHCHLNQHDEAEKDILKSRAIKTPGSANGDKSPYWRFGVLIDGLRHEAEDLLASTGKAASPK